MQFCFCYFRGVWLLLFASRVDDYVDKHRYHVQKFHCKELNDWWAMVGFVTQDALKRAKSPDQNGAG